MARPAGPSYRHQFFLPSEREDARARMPHVTGSDSGPRHRPRVSLAFTIVGAATGAYRQRIAAAIYPNASRVHDLALGFAKAL